MLKSNVTLSQAIAQFDRSPTNPAAEGYRTQRAEILKRFPRYKWSEMRLDDYALGQPAVENTYCHWLEFKSRKMGGIGGGSARKLIIYKRKEQEGWYFPKAFSNEREAWDRLRSEFSQAFELAERGEWERIDELETLGLGPVVKLKSLHVYFPNEVLPVYSTGHLRHFLRSLDRPSEEVNASSVVALNRFLLAALRRKPAVEGWNTEELQRLLYNWRDPRKTKQVLKITPGKDGTRYWLMALGEGSKDWDACREEGVARFGFDKVGDLRRYESRAQVLERFRALKPTDKNPRAAGMCWQFCHVVKPGDVFFVKKGTQRVIGRGVVASDYRFEDSRPERKHVRDVTWWQAKREWVVAAGARKLPRFTLTDITEKTERIRDIESTLEASVVAPDPPTSRPYTIDDAVADLFLRREDIERLTELLGRKKNLVLQGPPGTGKTYLAQRLAWLLAGERSRDRIEVVQFHQSYGYEDFVRGYRPTEAGGFELRDGPFLHVCERARQDSDRPHVLVIDEINRGNLSRIFGELLMLIEADKRSAEWAVRMAYARRGEVAFYVPPNLYLIGTMNTADRSLALVDYALRRRFAFWMADPTFGADRFAQHLGEHGVPEPMRRRISIRLDALNEQILKDPQLGAGFRIGHSYFCQPPEGLTSDDAWNDWYTNVVRYEIEPLLVEYWFDNTDRAAAAVNKLLVAD